MDGTRLRVLEAAGPIFAEKGFRATTVREICQAAGVNLASVNYHFRDKEGLYLTVVQHAHDRSERQIPLPAGFEEQPAPLRLRTYVQNLLERMLSGPESAWERRLVLREVLQPTQACEALVDSAFRPHFEVLLGILSELLPKGTGEAVVQRFGFSVVGQCLFYRVAGEVIRLYLGTAAKDSEFALPRLAEHIWTCTMAAIDAHGGRGSKGSVGERARDTG